MFGIRSVVAADSSNVARQLYELCFKRLADRIHMAADAAEAFEAVARAEAPALLIVDAELPPAGGFALLDACRARGTELCAIVTARRFDRADEERAASAGALGYVPKPVRFTELVRLLRPRDDRVAPRARGGALVHAVAIDPAAGAPLFHWEIANVSTSGALVVSHAELPPGTRLSLELVVAGQPLSVNARVVRTQPPSWVGVEFIDLAPQARAVLEAYVRRETS